MILLDPPKPLTDTTSDITEGSYQLPEVEIISGGGIGDYDISEIEDFYDMDIDYEHNSAYDSDMASGLILAWTIAGAEPHLLEK